MAVEATRDVSPAALARYGAVIDVRSPAEFAEDHLPGAINLPVLSDAQRAEVGTIYVQRSRMLARRIGAAHVARNIAHHLETALADREGGFHPLIYCWRGGMRSNAMATILSQVGWRVSVLEGGYRTYRRWVSARLYDQDLGLNLILLDGHTGSAKTEMLGRLATRGVQTLDLEGLAEHRGSLFGSLAGRPQPSQKLFESRLVSALEAFDPARPVVAEAESSKIGDLMLPPAIWRPMTGAPMIELLAERDRRARYLVTAYADIIADRPALEAAFQRLPVHPSRQRLETWRELIAAGAFAELAGALMEQHYDPAYSGARKRHGRACLGQVPLDPCDPTAQEASADQIVRLIAALDWDPGRGES
jgi:tRNA 2-selenouridine synthase